MLTTRTKSFHQDSANYIWGLAELMKLNGEYERNTVAWEVRERDDGDQQLKWQTAAAAEQRYGMTSHYGTVSDGSSASTCEEVIAMGLLCGICNVSSRKQVEKQ